MDHSNLETASTYVNNLLLARGLLRNGKPVDFVSLLDPADTRTDHDREDRPSTKASASEQDRGQNVVQVINLVHDLILKRDVRPRSPSPFATARISLSLAFLSMSTDSANSDSYSATKTASPT